MINNRNYYPSDIYSFKSCYISSRQTRTLNLSLKDRLRKTAGLRGWGGGWTHKWPEEFKQRCAQCDYLSFFHAGCSFRGHYHLTLSVSQRQHTQKQVGLCHFNDSIASGVLHRLCSVTLQRPMWRERPPHLSELDHIRMGAPAAATSSR